jgi:hypothetical protein
MPNRLERERCDRSPHWKLPTILVAIAGVAVLGATAAPAGAQESSGAPRADAAHTLNGADTAHMHMIRSSGSLLFEEGVASGTLPGTMHAELNVGPTFVGSFTIYTRYGSLRGHGTGVPHSSGGRNESFGGTLYVSGGTGRYAHARGHGGFSGILDRKTDSLFVQTSGKLSY